SNKGSFRRIHRDYRELLRENMRERLNSNEGYLLYSKRSQVIEAVFGNIKQNKGRRQFYYRGIEKVRTEWRLICSGVNLNKIIQHLQGQDWKMCIREAFENC